jgi:hypothetical protein
MVDAGIPGDEKNIQILPSPLLHLAGCHGDEKVFSPPAQKPRSLKRLATERS